jgi:MFS family permease
VPRRLAGRARAAAHRFPGQFWLVFAATLVYIGSSAIVFPFFGVYMTDRLGISRAAAGLILGAASLAGLPMQVLGGSWADRRGRRGVMLFSLVASATVSFALAAVTTVWQAALLVLVNGALGWPLFLTASNAMIADLVEQDRTAEAYSVVRVAMNAGVVAGPSLAGFALAAGASFAWLFIAAGIGCAALFVVLLARLAETRPDAAPATAAGPLDAAEALAAAVHREETAHGAAATAAVATGAASAPPPVSSDAAAPAASAAASAASAPARPARTARPARSGYAVVLRDRGFLVFCLASLLPLFCYGQIVSTYPVYLTQFLGVRLSEWGLLLSLNAVLIVVIQYPLVRRLQGRDRVLLVALASALLGIGVGGSSLTGGGWWLWLFVVVFSFGEMLFVPLSTSLVSGMTTVAERGRYMGMWSLVWIGGQALSPLFAGWGMDTLGGRPSYFVIGLVGIAGAGVFVLARRRVGAARAG